MPPRWMRPNPAVGYRWWTCGVGRIEDREGQENQWLKLGPVTLIRYRWRGEPRHWIDLSVGNCVAWRIWPLPPRWWWDAEFGPPKQ